MKRLIFFGIALGLVGYIAYLMLTLPVGKFRAILLVPQDAIYIVETDEPVKTWKSISSSAVWKHLRTQPYFATLGKNADALDSVISKNERLFDILGKRKIVASAHMYRPDDYDFLFIVDLENASRLKFLEEYLSRIPLPGYSVSARTYGGYTINEFQDRKTRETIYVTFVDNLLLCSYRHKLIEAAINQKSEPLLGRDQAYMDISEKVSESGLFKLFVQYRYIGQFARIYMPSQSEFVEMLQQDLAFTGLSFNIREGRYLEMDGFTNVKDSADSYMIAALSAGNGLLDAGRVIPQRTAYYMSLSFGDFSSFFDYSLQKYSQNRREWQEYNQQINQVEKLLKIDIRRNFVSWIGNELVIVQTQPKGLGRDNEFAVIVKTKDIGQARQNLNFVSEQIRKRTPVKFVSVEHQGYSINYLSMKGFFRLLFGKLFARLDKPYYTIIDDYVIFSNHPQTIKNIISDYVKKNTLAQSGSYREFMRSFNPQSNIFIYVQTPVLHSALKSYVSADTWADMQRNKDYIVCFSQIGFQLTGYDKKLFETRMLSDFASMNTQAATQPEETLPRNTNPEIPLELPPLSSDPDDELDINDLNAEKYTDFYADGSKKTEAVIRDGFRHGAYREFHQNGEVKTRGKYRNDKRDGIWRFYDENGKETRRVRYRDGRELN